MAKTDKPNILIIWGDDIGVHNISAYNLGIMGYRMPNIDRIAKEGALFTDAYAQQSCTAGRASFIWDSTRSGRGSSPLACPAPSTAFRTGRRPSPTCSKSKAISTGQFGKNHLGDRDKHLPTATGSTSSSVTSTTSTQRRSRRPTTIRRIRSSKRSLARAECCTRTTGTG